MQRIRRRRVVASLLSLLSLFVVVAACDNVARVWDRDGGSGGGGGGEENDATAVRVPANNEVVRSTRPSVVFAGPDGSGLPATTPVVVLFDETMNADSIRASEGETPKHLYVRAQGSEVALPGAYRFFLDGRCVVFTPTAGFPRSTYEVVIGTQVADLDKQRAQRGGVVATFTTDGTPEAGLRVLATVPNDKERFVRQGSQILTILTAPVDESTVSETSFFLQDSSNARVAAEIVYPVVVQTVRDTRFLALEPDDPLDEGASYRLSVTNDMRFGEVRLDPVRRNPIASFTVTEVQPTTSTALGNASAGFPLGLNRDVLPALSFDVATPSVTRSGDKVVVRLYGLDSRLTTDTRSFVAASATATQDGVATVAVSLADAIGSVDSPRLKAGDLTAVTWIERGSDVSGARRLQNLRLDVTAPTVSTLGPPGDATSFVTDLGFSALFGTANEELGQLELGIGSTTLGLAGADATGRFWSQPILLTRSATPVPFTLAFVDRAGNRGAATINASITQRGYLSGDVTSTGSLEVEVYDDATLQVLAGARVLVEPGLPQKPAQGRVVGTSDANGLAAFPGRTDPSHTVTVIADGYHLETIVATTASRISMPLRRISSATASARINLVFVTGSRSRVGLNVLEDEALGSSVATATSSVRVLENAALRPNRPVFLSGFAGTFPPTTKPSFDSGGTQAGATSSGVGRAGVPFASPAPGSSIETSVGMLPATQNNVALFRNLAAAYQLDFGVATGLDTGNLVAAPTVSFELTLSGLAGACYVGPGIASGGPASFTIDGSYSSTAVTDFTNQGPLLWSTVQATDRSGNSSRNRSFFASAPLGIVTRLAPAAAIPTIVTPSGPFTGSPAVTVADRLDATVIANGLALRRLTARDGDGRRWHVLSFDGDAATGSDTLQFPDLDGAGATGLRVGTWSIDAADRLIVSPGFGSGALVFEDLRRLEATWAKAAAVSHVVQ